MQKPQETGCTKPPALTEDELIAVLADLAEKKVQAHLKQCPFCSAQLEEMRQIEEKLLMHMYRSDCPSADRLADYGMGNLIPDEAQKISKHLQTCLRCQQELAALEIIFGFSAKAQEPEPLEEPLWEPVKAFVQSIGKDFLSILQPQTLQTASQFRGNDKATVLSYSHRSVTLMLSLEKVANGLKINGSLLDTENQERWQDSHIELISSEDVYYMALLDENDSFLLENVPEGSFRVNVYHASGRILRIEDVNLRV